MQESARNDAPQPSVASAALAPDAPNAVADTHIPLLVPLDPPPISITAISQGLALERAIGSGYNHLFSEEDERFIKLFNRAAGNELPTSFTGLVVSGLSYAPFFFQRYAYSKMIVKDYDLIISLRKAMIRQTVESALGGVTQFIICRGGLDTLALKALSHPEATFFEIEQPATLNVKLEVLRKYAATHPEQMSLTQRSETCTQINNNLFYVSGDLTPDDCITQLAAYGLDPEKPTLIISEGATAYVSHAENEAFLHKVNQFFTGNCQLLISYMTGVRQVTGVEKAALTEAKETHASAMLPEAMIAFAGNAGFELMQLFNAYDIRPLDPSATAPSPAAEQEIYYVLQKTPTPNLAKTLADVAIIPCDVHQASLNQVRCD